jgi:hypothetical protein
MRYNGVEDEDEYEDEDERNPQSEIQNHLIPKSLNS